MMTPSFLHVFGRAPGGLQLYVVEFKSVALFLRYLTCKYTLTLKPGLGSLKVTKNDTSRSGTQDFLSMFHSNHRPISHRFRDKRRFPLKIANSPPPAEGVPLGFGYRRRGQKKL